MRDGRSIGLLLLAVSTMLPVGVARAQEDLTRILEDPYVQATVAILNEWDYGKLTLEKSAVAEAFSSRLKDFEQVWAQAGPENVERLFSGAAISDRWEELPDVVVPKFKLSTGAKLMMIASIYDNREQLSKLSQPKPEDLLEVLRPSLFLILSSAQDEAEKEDKETIDTVSIQRGKVWFFSFGWPFCCADDGR